MMKECEVCRNLEGRMFGGGLMGGLIFLREWASQPKF